MKYRVCPKCLGEGKIVNPAVSVWTESDKYDDPEGFQNMLDGRYDIICTCCNGLRVVTKQEMQEYNERMADHYEMLHEQGIYPGSPDYF